MSDRSDVPRNDLVIEAAQEPFRTHRVDLDVINPGVNSRVPKKSNILSLLNSSTDNPRSREASTLPLERKPFILQSAVHETPPQPFEPYQLLSSKDWATPSPWSKQEEIILEQAIDDGWTYFDPHEQDEALKSFFNRSEPASFVNVGSEEGRYPWPECGEVKKLECDLRKHMKRHTPYGCTFANCNMRFNFRKEWRKHENARHFPSEMWRCDIDRHADGTRCGHLSQDNQMFMNHLEAIHSIKAGTEESKTKCREMQLEREGYHNFWCGFCNNLITQPDGSQTAARSTRFKHIGDHFERDNLNIDEWVDIEQNCKKKVINGGGLMPGKKQIEASSSSIEIPEAATNDNAIDPRYDDATGEPFLKFHSTNVATIIADVTETTSIDHTKQYNDRSKVLAEASYGGIDENGLVEDFDTHSSHFVAQITARTMTDEGYQSMTKQEDVAVDLADEVSDADSVRTDNRDSALPRHVKERLSNLFAQEIVEDVQLGQEELTTAIDNLCYSLPDLLREFSTLVSDHARPGIQERACIFVRHQRK